MLELTLRLDKGVALTHQEMDTNLKELAKVNLSPGIPCVGITDADKGKLVMFDDSDNLAKLYERSPAKKAKATFIFTFPVAGTENIKFNTYGVKVSGADYEGKTSQEVVINFADYINKHFNHLFVAIPEGNKVIVHAIVPPSITIEHNIVVDSGGSNVFVSIEEPGDIAPTMPHRVVLGVVAKVEDNKVYCYDNTVLEVIAGEDINVPTGASIEDLQARVFPRLLFADNGGVATTATPAHVNLAMPQMTFGAPGVVGFALHSAKAGERILVRRLL